jgi:predicted transcriptional regulator
MAKDLVMAQIQVGALPPEEMHKELQKTYACLIDLKNKEDVGETIASVSFGEKDETPQESSKSKNIPANWKQSITKHAIVCMVCGAAFKQLSVRHLKEHSLDARSYRVKFGIPRTQPLSSKETTTMRKKIAQRSRPWEKAPTYIKAQERKNGGATKSGRGRRQAAAASA